MEVQNYRFLIHQCNNKNSGKVNKFIFNDGNILQIILLSILAYNKKSS